MTATSYQKMMRDCNWLKENHVIFKLIFFYCVNILVTFQHEHDIFGNLKCLKCACVSVNVEITLTPAPKPSGIKTCQEVPFSPNWKKLLQKLAQLTKACYYAQKEGRDFPPDMQKN